MIGALASLAWAAPVLEADAADPLARCIAAANDEAGIDRAPEPLTTIGRSDRIAVVVGVPCHRSEGIPSLAYSTRDATQISTTLQRAGFSVIPLLTLVDRDALDAALDRAQAALNPGGTLVVYFSGHGVLRQEAGVLRRYLVFSDTDLSAVRTTGLSVRTLDERVSRIEGASARIVVQDTCFAARPGGKSLGLPDIVRGGRAKGMVPPEAALQLRAGDVRLYASQFFEQAVESPEHRASLYTHHLLSALAGRDADVDGDGCVGILEAHTWARDLTEADRSGYQTPQVRTHTPENVLLGCDPGDATHAVVQVPSDRSWTVEVRDRQGALARRGGGAVDPGRYRIRVADWRETGLGEVDSDALMNAPFTLGAGQWLDVAAELDERAPIAIADASGQLRGSGTLPSVGAGLGGWWAARDRGGGRLAVGGVGTVSSGQLQDCTERSIQVEGRTGWWGSIAGGIVGVGPVLATGPAIRTLPLRCSAAPVTMGWTVSPGLHGHLLIGRAVLSLDGGAQVLPIERDNTINAEILPTLRIGLGARL